VPSGASWIVPRLDEMRKALLTVLGAVAVFVAAVLVLRRGRTAPAEEGIVSEQPLETMTRDELYEIARELEIPGRSNMKKAELRAAVSRAGRSG